MRILFLGHQPEDPKDKDREPRLQALLQASASPGTQVDIGYPDDFAGARVITEMNAQAVLTGLHHQMATAALIQKAVWAEQQGYDAVVQSNQFDPGVEASRLAVRIPVIGMFRTALHVATSLSDRLAILVPLPGHVPYTWRMLRTYGMQDFVADLRPLGIYGSNMGSRKDEIFERAVGIIKSMVEATRAEMIVPMGGAIIPQVLSPADIQREIGVPVTDNMTIGIRFAEMCVQLGMSHSPCTYPSAKLRYEDFGARAY